jgi:AraC-like DNA-binding protein
MQTDAALAAIHLAKMLDATGRQREIPTLLAGVIHTSIVSGKRSGALTALSRREDSVSLRFIRKDTRRLLAAESPVRMRKPTSRKGLSRPRDADRRRFERAAELYLHACYGTKTAARAEEFADYLRLARPYLSRVVPDLIGVPLHDYLRREQLDYAKHLLRTTPLTIDQIALASAFGTPWTFYRCFKSAIGMTPKEYRARLLDVPEDDA